MVLAEFDKENVELVPDTVFIPDQIVMSEYELAERRVALNYLNTG